MADSPVPRPLQAALSPHRLAQARERFLSGGGMPTGWVTPQITRSWARSHSLRALGHELAPLMADHLRERRERARLLLDCAQPELDGLAEHAIGHGCVVIVGDASGVILDEIGSPDFLPKAQRFALLPGVEWSEGQCGTNAIGTALAERAPVSVLGAEHFLAVNGGLGCAAAPIFTGRGEIAGVLDISGDCSHVDSHTLGLVRFASQQIEHRMMLAEAGGHLLRFHANAALLGTAREGLIVLDEGRIVAANRIGLTILGERWETLLDLPAEQLLGQPWTQLGQGPGRVMLPSGRQLAISLEPARARSSTVRVSAPSQAPVKAEAVVASSAQLQRALRVLEAGVAVLISGETGTGKEVFAKRLHAASHRRNGPFVAVNCAALPDTLIEAELFGYDEGAFTGARRRGSPGRLREADGGTLLLDEIGDMPLAMQTRLLRVLEERVVSPLGQGRNVPVDFQLVCATHRDLESLVASGAFRADLMYRVNGYHVALPPLRDRPDRRTLLMQLFGELGGAGRRIRLSDAAADALDAYPWPGNVREMATTLKTLIALASDGDVLEAQDLPVQIRRHAAMAAPLMAARPVTAAVAPLSDMTRDMISQALRESGGNVSEAARRLGVHRSTVYRHKASAAQ